MADLYTTLNTTGYPVAYNHFKTAQTAPYIVYRETGSDNFGADNKVYVRRRAYQIELYTAKKDLTAEGKVESALDNAEVYYDTSEVYIDSEELYQVTYYVEI